MHSIIDNIGLCDGVRQDDDFSDFNGHPVSPNVSTSICLCVRRCIQMEGQRNVLVAWKQTFIL